MKNDFNLTINSFKEKFENTNYKTVWLAISKGSITIVCQNPEPKVTDTSQTELLLQPKHLFYRNIEEVEKKIEKNVFCDLKIKESENEIKMKCYMEGN